ncbi:sulfatase-like hydrolase/transferase [Halosimplex sp. J119]
MASVAVVVLDTLRYDTFEEAFDWLPGRRFTRAYAPSHWTIPVHGSLFTGLYPSEAGVHGHSPSLDCPEPTLAERLREAGYTTRLFTANTQLQHYEGWDRGFDEFVGYWSLEGGRDEAYDWGQCFDEIDASGLEKYLRAVMRCIRADCATVSSLRKGVELYTRSEADGGARPVLDRIRATDFGEAEFCFVNLMETHTPYHPPSEDDDPVTVVAADAFADDPIDLDHVREAYHTSAAYLSDAYREVFGELREEFDYVVTLADHGELLGEHGMVNHSFGLWPELTHVPLVVSGPDVTDGVDSRVTSLLDVHQTVADLAGVSVDSRGQNLFRNRDPMPALFEYHGLLPFHEVQFERKDVPAVEYERRESPLRGFVTENGAYAHETHTRGFRTIGSFESDPRSLLEHYFADLDQRSVGDEEIAVSDDVMASLEDLGYA